MEHHRVVVNYYIKDLIEMYKMMIMHWPPFDDTHLFHPFCLAPKVKGFNVIKQVWFMKTHLGKNTLGKLNKKLTYDIPTLKGKQITNKNVQGIAISRMAKALMLVRNLGRKFQAITMPKAMQSKCNSWFFSCLH